MAEDLADRLDDLICAFDDAVGAAAAGFDAATFLCAVAAWIVLGGLVLLTASLLCRGGSGGSENQALPEERLLSSPNANSSNCSLTQQSEEIIAKKLSELKQEAKRESEREVNAGKLTKTVAGAVPDEAATRGKPLTVRARMQTVVQDAETNTQHESSSPYPLGNSATIVLSQSDAGTLNGGATVVLTPPPPSDERGDGAVDATTSPPRCVGSDAEAVEWVNECLANLWRSKSATDAILRQWRQALSDYNSQTVAEVSDVASYQWVY